MTSHFVPVFGYPDLDVPICAGTQNVELPKFEYFDETHPHYVFRQLLFYFCILAISVILLYQFL